MFTVFNPRSPCEGAKRALKGVVVKAKKETIQEVDSSTETKNDDSQLFLNAEVSEQTSIDGSTDIYLASELHAS